MTTGDAHVEIDWRAIPALTSLSTSDSTAACISPKWKASDRLPERLDVCCVDFVERTTGSSDISIVLRESVDVLCDQGNQRLLVWGSVRQVIDLKLVQHLSVSLIETTGKL